MTEGKEHLARAIVASVVGTALEWYDFFLYGSAAALVFPKLFFPHASPYAGALEAFGTYALGFAARPLGAALFGRLGDRVGRRTTLVVTLIVMGVASTLIGVVPTYASIGLWAPASLVLLRVVQGIGVGGEWGGAILIVMERGDPKRRGLYSSFPHLGVPLGLLAATGAFAAMNRLAQGDAFLAWGWRVPFLASVVLLAVGLAVRLGVRETPAFEELARKNELAKEPVTEVLRHHRREVLTSAMVRMSEQAPFYVFTAFLLDYGTRHLGYERGVLLEGTLIAAGIALLAVPYFGHLSDTLGRKRVYAAGAVLTAVWAFPYFALLEKRDPTWALAAVSLSLIPHNMQYGPQPALISETFGTRLRYSGAGLGYQLASVVAGGPAPLIAVWLVHRWGGYAVAAYVVATSIVTLVATWMLPAPSE